MPLSDDCASNIHEFCSPCDCLCHGYQFTLDEVKALYEILKHQYISHEIPNAHEATDKILKIVRDNESKPELDR